MKTNVICKNCKKEFKKDNYEIKVSKNHFCSRSCSATFNNKKTPKRKAVTGVCIGCGGIIKRWYASRKYCSHACAKNSKYKDAIDKWLAGEISGNKGYGRGLSVCGFVRRWLYEKHNNQCQKCGWSEIHPVTGKIPLQVEHIDGNSENTCPENLELLCPNCHSLTVTFMGLNRGNGRGKIKN